MGKPILTPIARRTLLGHPLFAGVFADEGALTAEAGLGGYAEVSFAPGEAMVYPAAPRWMGLILRGSAKVYSADAARQVLLRTIGAGDLVGAAQLFSTASPAMSRMIASRETGMLILEEAAVRRLLDASPRFRDNCLAFLADRVAFLNRKIATFTAGSTERRLALYLDAAAGEQDEITVTPPLSALADALDISRASLYRALETLEQDGFLIRSGRQFRLNRRAAMLARYH